MIPVVKDGDVVVGDHPEFSHDQHLRAVNRLAGERGGAFAGEEEEHAGEFVGRRERQIPDGVQWKPWTWIASMGGLLPQAIDSDTFHIWPANRRRVECPSAPTPWTLKENGFGWIQETIF